jgi:hypothetical protein
MTYSEKLQDPRWQKKRLEIMSRDGFECVNCFSKTNTLTVHHFYYISGRMPWEYPNGSMKTICRECHKTLHDEGDDRLTIFNSWEDSACFEIGRQISMTQQGVDLDEGCLFFIERAGDDIGWPPFEIMHLLKDAAEAGIMTDEWLEKLRNQVTLADVNKENIK